MGRRITLKDFGAALFLKRLISMGLGFLIKEGSSSFKKFGKEVYSYSFLLFAGMSNTRRKYFDTKYITKGTSFLQVF